MNEQKKCIECGRNIREGRKLELCSLCQARNVWKERYEELKREYERHKDLCGKVHADLWNRLKKHEPELTWDEDPD